MSRALAHLVYSDPSHGRAFAAIWYEAAMGQQQSRKNPRSQTPEVPERSLVRVTPTDDTAEPVERVLSRRQLIVEEGDILVVREVAGIWHAGPGLTSPTTMSRSQFRVLVRGQQNDGSDRVFAKYDRAVIDGEVLAAGRRVRLFYSDGNAFTLLKDYRPAVSA
jgi:hypothetical protein